MFVVKEVEMHDGPAGGGASVLLFLLVSLSGWRPDWASSPSPPVLNARVTSREDRS